MQVVKRRLKICGKTRIFRANQSWHEIAGRRIFFRSDWEYKYAQYLQLRKLQGDIKEWEHEPKTFWFDEIKRGTRSYLPDFKVTRTDGSHYWVEVKGYLDRKSWTKIKRFRKYYPQEELELVGEGWFEKNGHRFPTTEKKENTHMEIQKATLPTGSRWFYSKGFKKRL